MDSAPPLGIGQPTACAAAPNSKPAAALNGSSSARTECAAIPANSALQRAELKLAFASDSADRIALKPNRANKNGWPGRIGTGRSASSASSLQCVANGPNN